MSQTLMKTVKSICNYRQILSISFAPVFSHRKIKYPIEKNFSQNHQSSDFKTKEESVYEDEGELVTSVEDPSQPLVKLTIITRDGKEVPIQARVGMTVMKAIIKHNNLEMEAICGGELACTSCHVYCEDQEKYFTTIHDMEQDLLDAVPCSTSNSRLCCQMKIIKEFENVRIKIPVDRTNYFNEGAKKLR